MNKINTLLLALALLSLAACRKKSDPNIIIPATPTMLTLDFMNVVGNQNLKLQTGWYTSARGDSFKVTTYKYYISNISLMTEDGQTYTEPESYHLVNEEDEASKSFALSQIPAGRYDRIRFLIGVDEPRNTSGAQTGALDPLHAMFWDWNTGYIMAKIEGSSPRSAAGGNLISYHLGGFSGRNTVLRWVELSLPEAAVVQSGKKPVIHIRSDVAEWFKTPVTIDFAQQPVIVMAGADAKMMADNYADMFSIDHVHN